MPGQYGAFTAKAAPQRILSRLVPNDTVTLVNSDITNTAFIGNDPGSQPIPIPPLGSVTIGWTGKDTWISASGPPVIIYEIPAGTAWSPSPAQIAQQINAIGLATAANQGSQINAAGTTNNYLGGTSTGALVSGAGRTVGQEVAALLASGSAGGTAGGIPLLRNTINLGSGASTNLPANSTVTVLATTSINQPGYEGNFTLSMPASSGTVPFIKMTVVWTDSATGLTVGQRTFYMTCGNGPANALPFYISGPSRGNQVSITATNLDPSVAATLAWGFNMTSHVYLTDKIVQAFYAATAPNGFTNPSGTPNAGIIADSNPTVAISSTTSRLLAVCSGPALWSIVNTTTTASPNIWLSDPITTGAGLYGNPGARYGAAPAISNTVIFNQQMQLPFGPLLLQMVNPSGTTAITVGVTITSGG